MKKKLYRAGLWLLAIFAGMQLLPVDRANPPVAPGQALAVPAEVDAILRPSCYDCHSNETRWPWYTYVAPVSWWIAGHVHDGRRKLNFSEWSSLDAAHQAHLLNRMEDEIMEGHMPPVSYLKMHDDVRITPLQNKILVNWMSAILLQPDIPASPPGTP